MAVTVTVPAVHKEFTSLNVVKDEMNITGSSDDAVLVQLIQESRDFIVRYCGREFARETVVETFDSRGGFNLMMSRTPVISITQITDDGSTVSSTKYSIDDADAGLVFNDNGWRNTQMYGQWIEPFPLLEGKRDWSVTYVSGYVMPGSTEAARTLPFDLERASIDIVKTKFYQRQDDPTIQSEKTGDASITRYPNPAANQGKIGGIPPLTLTILDSWKRITV
jgi:hypothetical protein